MTENTTETPKRKRGRAKGMAKVPGSGRKKGVPDRTRVQTIERINQQADPIGCLIRIARGLKFEAAANPGELEYPTHDQQIDAIKTLARKVAPDQRAVELSGGGGEPFIFQFITPAQAGDA